MNRRLAGLLLALLAAGCDNGAAGFYQGYVEGKYVQAAPARAGRLVELPAGEGSRVAAGDVLFALDPQPEAADLEAAERRALAARARLRDLTKGMRDEEVAVRRAELQEARAAQALAAADLARVRDLFARRMVPRSDLDAAESAARQAEAQVARARSELEVAGLAARSDQIEAAEAEVEAADAAVAEARWALEQKRVLAPAAGTVEIVYHRAGEWVPAGSPVLSLLPDGERVVRFFVPEPELSAITLGQSLAVACDGCPAGLTATVSFIAREAEFTPPVIFSRSRRDKLVFLVEARIEAAGTEMLHPGLPVEVSHAGR
jgi:HlyD family secretion protein